MSFDKTAFDKIMEDITQRLTGDHNDDLNFLINEGEQYKSHEYSEEILRAIARLMYDLLPDEQKRELEQALSNDYDRRNLEIRKSIAEINLHVRQNNINKALVLAESLVDDMERLRASGWFVNDNKSEYYCFNNSLEEIIFREIFKPEKNICSLLPENTGEVYYMYGACLFEAKRYDEAKIILEKAVTYNPVNTNYLFELSEIYKLRRDWKNYLNNNHNCLKYAYSSKTIARCYRNLGFYYIEENCYELAIALYHLSIHYDPNAVMAYNELHYISAKSGLEIDRVDSHKTIKSLEKNGIQIGPNKFILDMAYSIGRNAQKNNRNEFAKYFYNIVFDLTGDEEIKKIIAEIDTEGAETQEIKKVEQTAYTIGEDLTICRVITQPQTKTP